MTTELTTTETTIAAALERLANEHQQSAAHALTKSDEQVFFRRWSSAFRKALYYYLQGTRPASTPAGCWLVSSATRGGIIHQVDKSGHCSCEAGQKGIACWHAALVAGVEVGTDDLDRFDGGDDDAGDTPTDDDDGPWNEAARDVWAEHEAEQRLWGRLSAVRAAYLRAA